MRRTIRCLLSSLAILLSAQTVAGETPKKAPPEEKSAPVAEPKKADKKNADVEVSEKRDETADAALPHDENRRSALRSYIHLKVVNPDDAGAAVKKETERLKGYVSYFDERRIVVKLPPSRLSDVLSFAAEQGNIIEKTLERKDLTGEIADLEGRLKSKLEILKRLRGFFDDSDAVATLEIEQTMTSLVMEIESVRGRLRLLNDQADWAVLDINFQFRERDRVVYVRSPFEWLNTASLDSFIEEF